MVPVMGGWQLWIRHPQQLWLRRALFQIHLWTGIAAGLYILVVCVTGSIVVYTNDLYRMATPRPTIVEPVGERLTDDQLKAAVARVYPGYLITHIFRPRIRNHAVDVWLERGTDDKKRLFDPYTGIDMGDSVAVKIRMVSWFVDLHDNLLGGATGRIINGIGGIVVTLLGLTGLIIWWPGIQNWRRSLTLRRKVGWKRLNWDLHSALGIWAVLFVILFGVTGAYLGIPSAFSAVADFLEPPTDANAGRRLVDEVMFVMARLHFGRFGGSTTQFLWAMFGLTPAVLFVTGAIMWWNRVLSPRLRRHPSVQPAEAAVAESASVTSELV